MPRIELVGGPRDGEIREVPELVPRLNFIAPVDLPMAWEYADPDAHVEVHQIAYLLSIPIRQRLGAVAYFYEGLKFK